MEPVWKFLIGSIVIRGEGQPAPTSLSQQTSVMVIIGGSSKIGCGNRKIGLVFNRHFLYLVGHCVLELAVKKEGEQQLKFDVKIGDSYYNLLYSEYFEENKLMHNVGGYGISFFNLT